MSYRPFFTWIVFLLGCTAVQAAPQTLGLPDNQVRIAVMSEEDFHPDRAVPGNVRSLPADLAARVIEQLNATRRFLVVERNALRRVLREQQFGANQASSDLDKVIEQTVANLPATHGWTIAAAASAADHNDLLKSFQDLGGALGADYLVYAVLEQHRGSIKTTAIPFSDSGRSSAVKRVDARLRLRVIHTESGRIIGADSIQTRISEAVFAGREAQHDEYAMFDHLGKEAALRVLDLIFPARLIDADPWIVNRGGDQLVKPGDRFDIVREGKEVRDAAGIVIGRLNSPVAVAEVVQVQDNFAVLRPLSGDLALNDLAVPQRSDAPAPQAAQLPAAAPQGQAATPTRPRLAVGLVKARSTASTGIDAQRHIPVFTDTLISRLTQNRRFQIIDRQEVDQLLDEQMAQAIVENRELPSAMGELAGADFIMVGSIADFSIENLSMRLPGSNRVVTSTQGRVEGNMRIVDARSGEILDSRKVSIFETLSDPAGEAQMISRLADAYADQTVINLIGAVFPIKVAAVVSGVAYVNRGSDGGLKAGDVLNLLRPGQPIVDPDTGVQLGVAEVDLGQITLIEVEEARAKARVDGLDVQVGDLLKPAAASSQGGSRAASAAPVGAPQRSGGQAEAVSDGEPLTLAVGQIQINPRGRNKAVRGGNVERVSNDLMVKLSQFPEFDVMERSQIDQVIDEKAFTAIAQGGSMPASMGALVGADYLVIAVIDDFQIREETQQVAYLNEVQRRYFGTVESTLRMVDVHSGKLVAADKIRLNERMDGRRDAAGAVADLLDLYSSELVYRISDNLLAREDRDDTRPARPLLDADRPRAAPVTVNRPNF